MKRGDGTGSPRIETLVVGRLTQPLTSFDCLEVDQEFINL